MSSFPTWAPTIHSARWGPEALALAVDRSGDQIARILRGGIRSYNVAAEGIEGRNIKGESIEGSHVQAETLTGNHLATNTIIARNIASDAILVRHLSAEVGEFIELRALEATFGVMQVDMYLQSSNYDGTGAGDGTQGFYLDWLGNFEANNAVFRGTIFAYNGVFAGELQAAHGSLGALDIAESGYIMSRNYSAGVSGWLLTDVAAELNNVVVRGTVYATAGEFGGVVTAEQFTSTTATFTGEIYIQTGSVWIPGLGEGIRFGPPSVGAPGLIRSASGVLTTEFLDLDMTQDSPGFGNLRANNTYLGPALISGGVRVAQGVEVRASDDTTGATTLFMLAYWDGGWKRGRIYLDQDRRLEWVEI